MEKPNEVQEPDLRDNWYCRRCNQEYCGECIERIEVEFDVEDDSSDGQWKDNQWNGEDVCPWCYNQLIDKAFPNTEKAEKGKEG